MKEAEEASLDIVGAIKKLKDDTGSFSALMLLNPMGLDEWIIVLFFCP